MNKGLSASVKRACVHGAPGASPRLRGLFQSLLPLAGFAAVAGWLARAMWPVPEIPTGFAAAGFVLLTAGAAFWIVRSQSRMKDFLRGAHGEQRVAFELAGLDERFHLFHGLSLSGKPLADCDHVVAGPTGIFLVETKNWRASITVRNGEVLYNGRVPDRPPIPQVKRGAAVLRQALADALRLDIPVRPILCFVDGALPDALRGCDGVLLCRAATIRDAILTEDPDHTPDAGMLARVTDLLEKLSDSQ